MTTSVARHLRTHTLECDTTRQRHGATVQHLERRVLISGGAGFLGSHLCEQLLERGCQVLCVDNFFTGARHHIELLLDHRRFELLRPIVASLSSRVTARSTGSRIKFPFAR